MKILSISVGHDSSLCILEDGKITHYSMEERISRKKHDWSCLHSILNLIDLKKTKFDYVIISYIRYRAELYGVNKMIKCFKDTGDFSYSELIINEYDHHRFHAYCGFYNSNFKKSLCIVVDGSGSYNDPNISKFKEKYDDYNLKETESVFLFNKSEDEERLYTHYYPVKKNLGRNYVYGSEAINEDSIFLYEDDGIKISSTISVGWKFEKASRNLGFEWTDAGKVMGLSQYKRYENYLKSPYDTKEWIQNVEYAYEVQKETQNRVLDLIKKYTEKTNIKNVIITGGYGLNCVANNFYKKELPHINLYVDPVCFDAGISIGAAYHTYKKYNKNYFKKIKPIKDVYVGFNETNYDSKLIGKNYFNCSYEDVVELLVAGNIVSIFQGKSEAGQRALGNRSLLFDPRVENGRDIVNEIKKRENFRPFAGSILKEHFSSWFETNGLKESKYMQYALKVREEFVEKIPAVLHVDSTCRVQTVSKKDNYHYYNLIKCFYKKTGVPILLNTSFNLAGEPLVETFEDAFNTVNNSKIEYLFIPEIKTMVYQKN
jgi:carbamoyltransferase